MRERVNHLGYKYAKYNVPVPDPLDYDRNRLFPLKAGDSGVCVFTAGAAFTAKTFTFRKCQTNIGQDRYQKPIMPHGHADCNS